MATKSLIGALINRAPVPFTPRRTGPFQAISATSGQEAQMRAMGSVGTLFSIVDRLSNSVSQVDWKLYRKATSGRKEDRTEVTRHLALQIWNKPNPFYTRQEFVEAQQQHKELTGEAWWLVARNPSMPSVPLELWPVRPDRMQPVPHPTDFISGYVYNGPEGEKVPFRREDVIFLRTPNPLDPYRGMGAVQTILTELDATKYSAEWNRNFFLNSAEPGGIIEVEKRLSDPEFDELSKRWREQHQGVAQAHRVAILEQGKWVDRKFSQRDMQFAELRDVSSTVIREAFGMPKFAIGDVEDVNRATAEASKAWFADYLMVPRLERIKQALNNDFLPLFGTTGQGLEFDYDNPVPEDEAAEAVELANKAKAVQMLVTAGYNPRDVLNVVGLPPMAFGATDTSQTGGTA